VVVVGDLVARFRSDTSDLERGGQVARQELKATEQQAQQTARALEIMAQAASKANPGQGSAGQILEVFQKANVQPTAAALAQAAKEMQNTAVAATRAVEPTRALAKAASDHAEGWKVSESQLVRFGTGLAGIGLGISLVGGAAALLHQTITAVVDSSTDWERSLLRVGAIYGDIAPRIVALSQAQAAMPGVTSSQAELLQANTAAGFLTTRYGVSPTLTGRLTGQAAQIGGLFLLPEDQRRGLQDAFLQYAQTGAGAGALESTLGRPFDPLTLARSLGFSSEAGLQALTPAQLATARAQFEIGTAGDVGVRGSTEGRGLLDARRTLEQDLAKAQGALQNRLEGQQPDDQRLRALITSETPRNALEAEQQQQQLAELTAREESYQKAVDAAQAALQANSEALADNERQVKEATAALAKLGVEAGGATAKLLTFTGSLEDPRSIARGDIAAQAQASVAGRAVGPNPLIARTPAEMAVTARETAEQQAYQSYVADRARANERDSGSAIRQYLQGQVQFGPGADRPAAQRALDEIQRRYLANTVSGQAQQAGGFAQRAETEAQDQLTLINVGQDERRLAVAKQLADSRREVLQTEGRLAPLLLQEANLQDRMVVAARDNLDSRRALIQAQQAALGPQGTTQDLDYQERRVQALAEQRQARLLLGQDASGVPSFDELITQHVGNVLGRAASGVDVQALDAQHNVDVVQRQRTAEDLGRQGLLTDLEAQGRALQDQIIPLNEAARLEQARQDVIARTLELRNLDDVAAQTAAQHAVDAASVLGVQAGAATRAAEDMAAGLDMGATNAERIASALDRSATIIKNLENMGAQQKDVDARIANGLGAGGIGPGDGTAGSQLPQINIPVTINGASDDTVAIVKAELDAFEQRVAAALARGRSSGAPSSSQLAGARR
jgi:hypothetical protein